MGGSLNHHGLGYSNGLNFRILHDLAEGILSPLVRMQDIRSDFIFVDYPELLQSAQMMFWFEETDMGWVKTYDMIFRSDEQPFTRLQGVQSTAWLRQLPIPPG